MANSAHYPKSEYKENCGGSNLFLRKSLLSAPVLILSWITGLLMLWTPKTFISVLGLPETTLMIPRIFMLLGFILLIIGINLCNRIQSKPFSSCSECKSKTSIEIHQGCEFYVCHDCLLYVRGGDFS